MRSRRISLLVIAALLALALLVAGCGGGGGGTTAALTEPEDKAEARPTLTKAELIRQGNDICGEVNAAVGGVASSAAETQTEITQTSNLYTGMIESIQKLGRPKEMDGYSEFMEAAEELAKVEGEVKLAAEREDTEALGVAASEATPALEEFQSEAAIYGFADCAEGPHAPEAATGETGAAEAEAEIEESTGEIEEVVPEEPVEEVVPEEEAAPEEEVEEVAPETGGAGGEIEEVEPEAPAEEPGESGGVGTG